MCFKSSETSDFKFPQCSMNGASHISRLAQVLVCVRLLNNELNYQVQKAAMAKLRPFYLTSPPKFTRFCRNNVSSYFTVFPVVVVVHNFTE